MDDGGITSGTRVISVGVRILVIVSFSLTHAESNTTQIYLQATPPLAHASTRARNFRTRAETHLLPISLEKCILHELSNLSLRVSGMSYRILQDAYVHQQTTQKSERRLKDVWRILRRHLNVCVAREKYVCSCISVRICMYLYIPAVNTVCRAPARATRVSYTVLTLYPPLNLCPFSTITVIPISRPVSLCPQKVSDSTSEFVRSFARLTFPPFPVLRRLPRLTSHPISLASLQLFFVHPVTLDGATHPSLSLPGIHDYIPRARRTPIGFSNR